MKGLTCSTESGSLELDESPSSKPQPLDPRLLELAKGRGDGLLTTEHTPDETYTVHALSKTDTQEEVDVTPKKPDGFGDHVETDERNCDDMDAISKLLLGVFGSC